MLLSRSNVVISTRSQRYLLQCAVFSKHPSTVHSRLRLSLLWSMTITQEFPAQRGGLLPQSCWCSVLFSCSCIRWSKLSFAAPSVGLARPSFSSPWISSKRACRLSSPQPLGKVQFPSFTEEVISATSHRHRSIFTLLSQLFFILLAALGETGMPHFHGFSACSFLWIFFVFDISC